MIFGFEFQTYIWTNIHQTDILNLTIVKTILIFALIFEYYSLWWIFDIYVTASDNSKIILLIIVEYPISYIIIKNSKQTKFLKDVSCGISI